MSGRLTVVGLGPGDDRFLTPEAREALASAEALYGYGPYLDRVPVREGQARNPSGNRVEGNRAQAALAHAARGAHVAMVSGGDPGVFPWRRLSAARSRMAPMSGARSTCAFCRA